MEVRYPDLKTRVQSVFIDSVLMIVLMFVAGVVLDRMDPSQSEDDGWIKAIIFILILGTYEPVTTVIGCTLGNYLMKIRVKKFSDNTRKINLLQAYIRFIVKILLGWISFITINSNKEKRAIHDFAAGTLMVEK
jgi:uncharacterized RDD family membrane protein YckC